MNDARNETLLARKAGLGMSGQIWVCSLASHDGDWSDDDGDSGFFLFSVARVVFFCILHPPWMATQLHPLA